MNARVKRWILTPFNILYRISPVMETKLLFFLKTGRRLDLKNPKGFNEKLQWIKLYDKDSRKPRCADKYTVREFVRERGCGELLNDLLWEGYDPEEIPFDSLPERFVIKATHGQGMNIIWRGEKEPDREKIKKTLKRWLKEKYLPCYGEWFYGVIPPRIIVERFLGEDGGCPADYKVFCFDGEPKFIDVHTSRFAGHKRTLYDLEWNVLRGVSINYPADEDACIGKPEKLDEMLSYARKLSRGFVHVRVDFYIVGDTIYFGEMTFTNGAGFSRIKPRRFDLILGQYIKLQNV